MSRIFEIEQHLAALQEEGVKLSIELHPQLPLLQELALAWFDPAERLEAMARLDAVNKGLAELIVGQALLLAMVTLRSGQYLYLAEVLREQGDTGERAGR